MLIDPPAYVSVIGDVGRGRIPMRQVEPPLFRQLADAGMSIVTPFPRTMRSVPKVSLPCISTVASTNSERRMSAPFRASRT